MSSPTSLFPVAIKDASKSQVGTSLLVLLVTIATSVYAGHALTLRTAEAQAETAEAQANARHEQTLAMIERIAQTQTRLADALDRLDTRAHVIAQEQAVIRSHISEKTP